MLRIIIKFLCSQNKQHWSPGNISPHLLHFSATSLLLSLMSITLASLLSLTEADSIAGFECPTDSGLAHHAYLYCCEIDHREAVTECAPADARLPSFTGLTFRPRSSNVLSGDSWLWVFIGQCRKWKCNAVPVAMKLKAGFSAIVFI